MQNMTTFRPIHTVFCASLLTLPTACSDDGGGTTVVTTIITTPSLPTLTDGGTDETTGDTSVTPTTDAPDSETSDSETSDSETMTTEAPETSGGVNNNACLDDEFTCDRIADGYGGFCPAVMALGTEHEVEDLYLGFVVDMCLEGELKCVVCFNLENYCAQVGVECEELQTLCACIGDYYGVE